MLTLLSIVVLSGIPLMIPIISTIIPTTFGLDTIIIILGAIGTVLGIGYTWREKRINSLTGYRSYEKDLQEQMKKDIKDLRAGNEKYIMLRRKVLDMPHIDGNLIIQEIETEYKQMNP